MTRSILAAIAVLFAAPVGQAQRPDFPDLLPPFRQHQRPLGPGGWANPAPTAPVTTPVVTPLGTPPGFFSGLFPIFAVPFFLAVMALLATALGAKSRRTRPVGRRRRDDDFDDDRDDRPRRRPASARPVPLGKPALAARVADGPSTRRATPKLLPPAGPRDIPFG